MPFHSVRFSQRCLNCRENNGGEKKSTYRDMVLLAVAFPPPPTFLCLQSPRLALDKAPPARSSRAPVAGKRSSRAVFKALSDPAFAGQPLPDPRRWSHRLSRPFCPRQDSGEAGKVLYRHTGRERGIGFKSKQAAGSGFRNAAWNFACVGWE